VNDIEPSKMTLTNVRTGRTLEVQFNPPEIEAKLSSTYNMLKVLGLSHEPQQFQQLTNLEVPLELFFDRLTAIGGGGGGPNYMSALNFLRSLQVPNRADSVLGGGAPDVLFVWPRLYRFVCRVHDLTERHQRFARDGRSTMMVVRMVLRRFRSIRYLGDEVERDGFEETA